MNLQPPATLLMGPAGSGKTTSLSTLAKAGLEVFVFITEPTGVDSLLDAWERQKLNIDLLHYCTIPPASPGWKSLKEMGQLINAMSYKDLSELKMGIAKSEMKQYPKILSMCENFICDRTGVAYGDVTEWDAKRALAFDSLSGLSEIMLQHTVGFKPSPHQGEWGIAMSAIDKLLLKLSSDCKCFFVLTSHIEKEPDEITGSNKVMVSTLGKKLAPKIPKFFSEVVRARKDGAGQFYWATIDADADLKNRALPSNASLTPDFSPIVDAYRRRVTMSALPKPEAPATSEPASPPPAL